MRRALLDRLGRLIDKADNFVQASTMPLPPALHADALKGGVRDIRDELLAIYLAAGGEDVWDAGHP